MTKVRIVGPKALLDQATEVFQSLSVIHIESSPTYTEAHPLSRFSLDPDHQRKKADLERMQKDLNHLVLALPEVYKSAKVPVRSDMPILNDESLARIHALMDASKPQIESLLAQIRECEEEQGLLIKYERVLEALAPLLGQIQDSRGLDFLGLILEVPATEGGAEMGTEPAIRGIRRVLAELTANRYELLLSRIDLETMAGLLVVPRELSSKVRASLWEENISELRLPASVSDKPVGQALKVLLRRRLELPGQLHQLRESLQQLSLQWRAPLQAYEKIVVDWLAQLESTVYFYQTRSTFLVYGWIPKRDLSHVQRRLMEAFWGAVVMERVRIVQQELGSIPVALKNPWLVKPFEPLTRLVALPRYGSIDPTPYLALFFPFFFGMILGDIGYGAILLGLTLYARKRWRSWPLVQDFSVVFIFSSCSAIFFGLLYGEFFGELGEPLGIHPLLLNRMEGFMLMLKITLAIGLTHVLLGILLGLVTAIRHRHIREAAVKVCGLAFLGSLGIVLGALAGVMDRFYVIGGGVLAIVMLPALFILGGARGAMELHNVVNILSYLRLMGIGVASAALAFAANTLGSLVGNVVIGVLIGLVLHFINLVFGIVSPTIQSLRLHYVEFFENFFQPGGREYRPFRKM
jgi:V/A-type H+-transporting ATPase subunit I